MKSNSPQPMKFGSQTITLLRQRHINTTLDPKDPSSVREIGEPSSANLARLIVKQSIALGKRLASLTGH